MDFVTRSKEGGESNEEALVERLRQFVENSDLSFYKIASRIGTSGGHPSMCLLGRLCRTQKNWLQLKNSLKASLIVPFENPSL
jgi:DNA transposition AAA+ family ATPase